MAGEIVGRAVNAVLVPPQAARFAALVGADTDRLVLNVTGWNKLVLLGRDRVFLFPRAASGVEWFERETAAYRALAQTSLTVVPRLQGRWEDPDIYPFPFEAVTRLRGEVSAEPEALTEQLGRTIACWHELEPPPLAGARPPRHHDAAHHRWLRRALDPAMSAEAVAEAADRLGRPDRGSAWADLLASAARLGPVLVHGDLHEDQLLAEGGRLTGIIDWETARVDHPFWDFDLGEWGTGLWRRRPAPARLFAKLIIVGHLDHGGFMSHGDGYLGAAGHAVALLREPGVAAAWAEPSALAEMTVGGLAGHLTSQIFLVGQALGEPPSGQAPIQLEHYARAAWVGAPLDSEVNAGIRSRGEGIGAEGAAALAERAGAALTDQRAALPGLAGDRAVFLPWVGWALTLDDFLTTRTMELAVHLDDLAVSAGHATPELPDAAFDPVLTLLARVAARRHGQAAMLRALARAERAPAAISAN